MPTGRGFPFWRRCARAKLANPAAKPRDASVYTLASSWLERYSICNVMKEDTSYYVVFEKALYGTSMDGEQSLVSVGTIRSSPVCPAP